MDPLSDPNTYFKVLSGLLLTLGAFLAFGWWMKKFPSTLGLQSHGFVKILARQDLDKKHSFLLIETCGKVYLLYGPMESLQVIDSFDPEEIREFLPEKALSLVQKAHCDPISVMPQKPGKENLPGELHS